MVDMSHISLDRLLRSSPFLKRSAPVLPFPAKGTVMDPSGRMRQVILRMKCHQHPIEMRTWWGIHGEALLYFQGQLNVLAFESSYGNFVVECEKPPILGHKLLGRITQGFQLLNELCF